MMSSLATVVVAVIESVLSVVDRVLAGIPNPVPSSGQLRQIRGRTFPTVINPVVTPVRAARRPLLAAIGTADLLADQTKRLGVGIDLSFESWSSTSEQWSRITASTSTDRDAGPVSAGRP
jgi:hypothetical protein